MKLHEYKLSVFKLTILFPGIPQQTRYIGSSCQGSALKGGERLAERMRQLLPDRTAKPTVRATYVGRLDAILPEGLEEFCGDVAEVWGMQTRYEKSADIHNATKKSGGYLIPRTKDFDPKVAKERARMRRLSIELAEEDRLTNKGERT